MLTCIILANYLSKMKQIKKKEEEITRIIHLIL
jgi:hypothetical protein